MIDCSLSSVFNLDLLPCAVRSHAAVQSRGAITLPADVAAIRFGRRAGLGMIHSPMPISSPPPARSRRVPRPRRRPHHGSSAPAGGSRVNPTPGDRRGPADRSRRDRRLLCLSIDQPGNSARWRDFITLRADARWRPRQRRVLATGPRRAFAARPTCAAASACAAKHCRRTSSSL